jgi:translation initiation factor 4G
MEPDLVQRKVKAALNKMTPEKFDKIADQILAIAAQSKDEADGRTLRQVIQLTFEKATDEAHWASMYARFCKRMLETMSPEIKDESILDKNGNIVSGGNLFRKYLLNRCQEEFERGWKMDLPDKPEGEPGDDKTPEAVMLSDEYYIAAAAKRRGLGLVQFIGELYKLSMLTERIMHECVKKLVDYTGIPDEAEIESLTKLLKTIGGNLDSTEKGKPMMDVYFSRIQSMIDTPELPSRLRFMLMDIVDLRKKRWQSKEDNKGPKTLEEVRAEVCFSRVKESLWVINANLLLRLRQLPLRRLLRMLVARVVVVVVVVVVADECQWAVVIQETIRINMATTSPRLITKRTQLVWMISAVSPTKVQTGQQVNKCLLAQHLCFRLEVTAAARWVPAVH